MPTDAELRLQGAYLVAEWMRIRTKENCGRYDFEGLKCDLDHSALIHWLCQGNAALDVRPPVRMSRPDHRAGVNGRFTPYEVTLFGGGPLLIVDQEGWTVVETRGPDDWIAVYTVAGSPGHSPPWRVRRTEEGWEAVRLPASTDG